MSQILTLLTMLGDFRGQTSGRWSAFQVGLGIALMSLTCICAAGAIGCCAAAIWIFSAPAIGSGGAALVTAGAFLLPCVIIIIACRRGSVGRPQVASASGELEFANLVVGEAKRLVCEHKVPVLLAALLAGLATSDSKRDR